MGVRRVAAALAAAAVVVALAACTPDDDVTEPPPTSGPTTESAEPTSDTTTTDPPTDDAATPPDLDPPERPASMDVDDLEGAGAAVTYFFDVINYSFATGDTRPLAAMSASDCVYCVNVITTIEGLHAQGGWAEVHGAVAVDELELAYPDASDPLYLAVFTVTAPDNTTFDADGGATDFDGYTVEGAAMSLEFSAGSYKVAGYDRDAGA